MNENFNGWMTQVCIYLGLPASDKETFKENEWWAEQYFKGRTFEKASSEWVNYRKTN
jgi:hypothetical protein